MKSRIATVLLLGALAAPVMVSIGGCAMGNTSIAKENYESLGQKLVPGKTSKAQVLKEFGEPSEKAIVSGRETWRYRMVDLKFVTFLPFYGLATGSDNSEMTDVVVTFDRAGLVVRHDMIKTKG